MNEKVSKELEEIYFSLPLFFRIRLMECGGLYYYRSKWGWEWRLSCEPYDKISSSLNLMADQVIPYSLDYPMEILSRVIRSIINDVEISLEHVENGVRFYFDNNMIEVLGEDSLLIVYSLCFKTLSLLQEDYRPSLSDIDSSLSFNIELSGGHRIICFETQNDAYLYLCRDQKRLFSEVYDVLGSCKEIGYIDLVEGRFYIRFKESCLSSDDFSIIKHLFDNHNKKTNNYNIASTSNKIKWRNMSSYSIGVDSNSSKDSSYIYRIGGEDNEL